VLFEHGIKGVFLRFGGTTRELDPTAQSTADLVDCYLTRLKLGQELAKLNDFLIQFESFPPRSP
jgi:hypothetical protein